MEDEMRLENVRALKAELCASGIVECAGGIGRARLRMPAGVSLGVVQGTRDGCRLALRLHRHNEYTIRFAERVTALAPREVDAQFVGFVHGPQPAGGGDPALTIWNRPLLPGLSIGHAAGATGSLGFFGIDPAERAVIVSNAHVLCPPTCHLGDSVVQPGVHDGGAVPFGHTVAYVSRAATPTPGRISFVDAAAAVVAPGVGLSLEYGAGRVRGLAEEISAGTRVWKKGRTTGFTRGEVTAVELDGVEVRYGTASCTFDGQVEIRGFDGPFSAGGDSGSLVLDAESRAVALIFAGTTAPARNLKTYANPIGAVLAALDVRVI
jgi:hypothetical protein